MLLAAMCPVPSMVSGESVSGRGWGRVVLRILVAGASLAGCAHGDLVRLSPEMVEAAYVQARLSEARCRPNDAACCAELARAARATAALGGTAGAAQLWHEVALACPQRRDEAAAAMLAAPAPARNEAEADPRGTPAPAPARNEAEAASATGPVPEQGILNVTYRPRLSPDFRLFWVGTAIGPRLLPTTGPVGSKAQSVQVEVHAIRFERGRPGPLLRVQRRFDLSFEGAATVTLEIAEVGSSAAGGASLDIRAQVDRVAVPRPVVAGPAARGPAPRLEKVRPLRLDPLRAPPELGSQRLPIRPVVRVCLDREGQVETVRFLEPAHPRLAAAVIDMLRDSEHEPYRVNDLPVPSCEVLPLSGQRTAASS